MTKAIILLSLLVFILFSPVSGVNQRRDVSGYSTEEHAIELGKPLSQTAGLPESIHHVGLLLDQARRVSLKSDDSADIVDDTELSNGRGGGGDESETSDILILSALLFLIFLFV